MSTPNENRHTGAGHTSARFISAAQRAQGITPEQVAAELAAEVAAQNPDQHAVGSRGISVKVIRHGSTPLANASTPNVRHTGAMALELAKLQGALLGVGADPDPLTFPEASRILRKLDAIEAAAFVEACWVEVDAVGRVVSPARSLLNPSPSGAEGQGASVGKEPTEHGASVRAFSRAGGEVAQVFTRNQTKHVTGSGYQRVGATPGSTLPSRTYGATVVVNRAKTVAHAAQAVAAEAAELAADAEGLDLADELEALREELAAAHRSLDELSTEYAAANAAALTAEAEAAMLRETVSVQAAELASVIERFESRVGDAEPGE